MEQITIRGARTHNLRGVDLTLPRDQLIVITGLSGSGKSSLAFDTIYAEGQRRYVESLSSYARQFLSLMEKPDVDSIEGLSPAISIEQKATSHNPRSTVGTTTEIHDYLRLLYARVGEPRCPEHGIALKAQTVSEIVDLLLELPEGTRLILLAPIVQGRKGEHLNVLQNLERAGFLRARINGDVVDIADAPTLDKKRKHSIDLVVDRLVSRPDQKQRLAESIETAIEFGDGVVKALIADGSDQELMFSARYACPQCGYSLQELEPRLFSFNNPSGACHHCDGLGVRQFFDPKRIVREPSKSLANGAISGWDRRSPYYFAFLQALAREYDFDIDEPWQDLPLDAQATVLNGTGGETIRVDFPGQGGSRNMAFEGVVNNLQRRYRETDSQAAREELASYISSKPCSECDGSRLRVEARNVFVNDQPIHAISKLSIEHSLAFFQGATFTGKDQSIADKILSEIAARLGFLNDVGLKYLSLDRATETLSGGEAQRIRLASQIGSGLVGVMYVLDEPSIGLHQRDNDRLLATLFHLRDLGNSVLVVEHDEDAIRHADYVVDLGPGAGAHGGYIVAQGTPADIEANEDSLTGRYLSGLEAMVIPKKRRKLDKNRQITLSGATGNNLQAVTARFPLGLFTCVTGVSGSGKSTLVNDTLYPAVAETLYRGRYNPSPYTSIAGIEEIDKIIDIDQSPIGRTPRSNPATYTGMFTPIREMFAGTPEARARGYKPGRFSFNVRGGRCEACQGDGLIKVEMHFLPDVYVSCDICKGKRYNRETLEVLYKGKTIDDVLAMTIEDASEFFAPVPTIKRKLDTLVDVGLGYIKLGQSATTLSGGEAQRVKLSRELSKRGTGKTLYILDEPTTGLHFHDIKQLLAVIQRLADHGNTVIVIEHNLDVIKSADWLIDLGPEGGAGGGTIVASGTPEAVAACKDSHTGHYLKPVLDDPRLKKHAKKHS
ncbi:excinuclease ABC subunit UvrA [Gammaproteobacteria bacterium]|nr:excinuclease ABC subunit UvrA [Gammaproteobacteria bacterium]